MQLRIKGMDNQKPGRPFMIESIILLILLIAHITRITIIVPAVFGVCVILLFFSEFKFSTLFLACFTSFSKLFVFHGISLFFLLVLVYIVKSFVERKVAATTIIYYFLIVLYTLLFCNLEDTFKVSDLMGLTLIFAVPIVGINCDEINCAVLMKHYIYGFILATIVGYFIPYLPGLQVIFSVDKLWSAVELNLNRFSGLSYDSNFYSLSNYIILAYLMFADETKSKAKIITIFFLLFSGLRTFSKSYFLVVAVLMMAFIFKNMRTIKKMKKTIVLCIIGIVGFGYISKMLGYNMIELILDRFVKGGFAKNTTGRTEIWEEYWRMFSGSGFKNIVFGAGFNTKLSFAAHNTYIEFVYAFGIVGFVLWCFYFGHCYMLFAQRKAITSIRKTPWVAACLVVGVFFISSYTYEAFWIAVVIAFFSAVNKKEQGEI